LPLRPPGSYKRATSAGSPFFVTLCSGRARVAWDGPRDDIESSEGALVNDRWLWSPFVTNHLYWCGSQRCKLTRW